MKTSTFVLTMFAASLASTEAMAQTHDLSVIQIGASLDYADAEAKLLFAAITAKQFDIGFTKQTLGEIKTSLAQAKRSIDRAEALLPVPMEKHAPKLKALRDLVVAAEAQFTALQAVILEQTKSYASEEEEEEDEEASAQPDWRMLEQQTAWLSLDIDKARKSFRRVAQVLKAKPPRVKKPRGKRQPITSAEGEP